MEQEHTSTPTAVCTKDSGSSEKDMAQESLQNPQEKSLWAPSKWVKNGDTDLFL